MKKTIEILIFLFLLAVFIFVAKDKLAAFYYNQGCNYYENNSLKEAIDYFNKSLKVNPAVTRTHYSLANAYDRNKQREKAIQEYKKAIQLDSRFLWGYEALADAYLGKGDYQQAAAILREAEISLPGNQRIKYLMNLVSLEYAIHFINSGVDAFSSGDKAKGYELLNKALQINPDFAIAYHTLGYFYYSESKYDQALEMLNKALFLDSKLLLTHKLLGDIYFEKGVFDKAIDAYKAALSIDTQDPSLLNNLGLAFMNLEDYQEAAKFLEEAVSLNPTNINLRYNLASVYRDAGRTSESLLEYKKVVQEQPDYPNVHNDLADIYKQNEQREEALKEYQKEINSCQVKLLERPNDPFLLNDLSYAYNGIGQCAKAKMLIDKALEIKPDSRQIYLTLAGIQNNLGEQQDALASLEKAKKLSKHKQIFIEEQTNRIKKEMQGIIKEKIKFQPTELVYLKNGRQFEGVVKKKSKDGVILEINVGSSIGTIMLAEDSIERIVSKK